MKIKLIKISTAVAILVIAQAMTFGQKTEVSVQKGKVVAQTAAGSATVEAGKKAVLSQNGTPAVTIDDPMAGDLLEMYKWVEAEKNAGKIRIDSSSIQITSIDNERIWKCAGLVEFTNYDSQPTSVCTITGTMILEDPKYYDMDGNLLTFTLEQTSKLHGNYTIHLVKPVPAGEKYKLIIVGRYSVNLGFWNDGLLWHQIQENNPRYCVNYFRVILPKSAIFVGANQDIITADNVEGRIAITTRNYTGANARGLSHIRFLWPEKDGKNFADLAQSFAELGDLAFNKNSSEEAMLVKKLDSMLWDKSDEKIVQLYKEFNDKNVKSAEPWFTLGIKLTGGGYLEEALVSFDKCCQLTRQKIDPDYIASVIWKGHIYDLLGKREEAISQYKEALSFLDQFRNSKIAPDFESYVFMRHDQWGIKLSYNWVKERLEKPFTTSMLAGNQLTTLFKRFEAIPWDKGGPEILDLYNECTKNEKIFEENGAGEGWTILGIKLVGGGYFEQAFDAFSRGEKLSTNNSLYYFTSLVWEGHLYDIKGMRNEAIAKYKNALEVAPEEIMRHDQWGIVLNYKWVKERLEKPFTKEMIGK